MWPSIPCPAVAWVDADASQFRCRSPLERPDTGGMRTTDRHARNDRIVYLRLQGWTITKIAAECGMSERQCARILEERKQTGWSGPGSPVVDGADLSSASASELLDALEARVGDLARMAREQPAQQQSLGRALRLEVTVKMAERK